MFDHLGIIVADAGAALRFYENGLKPLGLRILQRHPNGAFILAPETGNSGQFLYVGPDAPDFWQSSHEPSRAPIHVCFAAPDKASVEEFHRAALSSGGKDNGAPGERDPGYYAAYVIDPDGNNIEAAFRSSS